MLCREDSCGRCDDEEEQCTVMFLMNGLPGTDAGYMSRWVCHVMVSGAVQGDKLLLSPQEDDFLWNTAGMGLPQIWWGSVGMVNWVLKDIHEI